MELTNLMRGVQLMPPRIFLYGQEGIGKSTFASEAPQPVFIPCEDGLSQINCVRFPLVRSFAEVMDALSELWQQQHDFKTVVIDSLGWLERMIFEEICAASHVSSIEKAEGGYGKGYVAALGWWRRLLEALSALRNERGMAVILVDHARVERFEDPEAPAYDRYTPKINKHASALICEWCDAVLFARRRISTSRDGDRNVAAAVGQDRIIRCVTSPSCVAKNHYSISADLPLSWSAWAAAMSASQNPTPTKEQANG